MMSSKVLVLFGLLCVVAFASAIPGEVRGDVEGEPGMHSRRRANIPPPPTFTPEGEEDPAAAKKEAEASSSSASSASSASASSASSASSSSASSSSADSAASSSSSTEAASSSSSSSAAVASSSSAESASASSAAEKSSSAAPAEKSSAAAASSSSSASSASSSSSSSAEEASSSSASSSSAEAGSESSSASSSSDESASSSSAAKDASVAVQREAAKNTKEQKKEVAEAKQVLGENEGTFDAAGYKKLNRDVGPDGDAWAHYVKVGHKEGRRIKVSSGGVGRWSDWGYYKLNPSVKRAGFNAWDHYVRFGHTKGLNIAVIPMDGDKAKPDKLGCSVCRVLVKRIFNFKSHKPGQLCKLAPKANRKLCQAFIRSESQNFLSEVNLRVDRAPEPCVAIGVCPAKANGAATGIVGKELDSAKAATTLLEADVLLAIHDDALLDEIENQNAVNEDSHALEASDMDPDALLEEDDLTGAEFSDEQNSAEFDSDLVNTAAMH